MLGGVDVARCVADNEDLVWGELVMQTRGLGDGEARELAPIGGVRAVRAEKKEPVEIGWHELRTRGAFHCSRYQFEGYSGRREASEGSLRTGKGPGPLGGPD